MRYALIGIAMMGFMVVSLAGFRGDMSRKPPLEVFPDMDRQPKLRPLEPNDFFKNGMSSQPLVKGTVPRSEPIVLAGGDEVYPFQKNHPVNTGFAEGTNTVASIPIPVTMELMKRGQERMMMARQSVHDEHPPQRTKRAQQNGKLVRHGKSGESAEERLASDHDVVIELVHEPDHQHARNKPGEATEKGKPAHLRVAQPHGIIHAVHGKRRVHVPFFIAGLAHLHRRRHDVGRRIVFG